MLRLILVRPIQMRPPLRLTARPSEQSSMDAPASAPQKKENEPGDQRQDREREKRVGESSHDPLMTSKNARSAKNSSVVFVTLRCSRSSAIPSLPKIASIAHSFVPHL
jgi:hypothetical protein